MTVPPALLAAISASGGGRLALVIGAGCSMESPTSLPLSRGLSEEAHRRLVADGVIANDECGDPSDLSQLADLVYDKFGSHDELVSRFPLAEFENATPNEGYRIAAALLREHAISDVLTLNFDRAAGHALSSVGAGAEVGVITSPQSVASAVVNVIHLHRDVRAPADDWVLRTDQIEQEWEDGWEELVATRVMTGPMVVFVGLGTAAAVLVETMRKIRAAIETESGYHVDPDPYGTSPFTLALDIPPERFVQMGWTAFMRSLGERLVVEHVEAIRSAARRIEAERGLPSQNLDVLFDILGQLGLLDLGELRARWLLSATPYLPARLCNPSLLGDLAQATCVLADGLGVGLIADRDGCFQMRIDSQVVGLLVPASGAGTRDWAQLEAETFLNTGGRGRSAVDRTVVLAAGVVGARMSVAPPEDLIGDMNEESIASASARPMFVDANELRLDPEAALAGIR